MVTRLLGGLASQAAAAREKRGLLCEKEQVSYLPRRMTIRLWEEHTGR